MDSLRRSSAQADMNILLKQLQGEIVERTRVTHELKNVMVMSGNRVMKVNNVNR